VTYHIRKESGEYTWFETLTEPILDESGEVVRLQTASRDVSEHKRAEEALAEAASARAEFLAEVSHELRTPLTVIRGNAEVGLELDRDCEHEEVLREIVR
jgi:signal transduction histidine kinase